MSEEDVAGDRNFDAELAALLRDTAAKVNTETLEELSAGRQRVLSILEGMQRETLHGALESEGAAAMDFHDQQSWKVTCRNRGRMLYAELRWWALLYQYDLLIAYAKHGYSFGESPAMVEAEIFAGMMQENQEWVHLRMGDDPPSERGKMILPES